MNSVVAFSFMLALKKELHEMCFTGKVKEGAEVIDLQLQVEALSKAWFTKAFFEDDDVLQDIESKFSE